MVLLDSWLHGLSNFMFWSLQLETSGKNAGHMEKRRHLLA